LSRQQFGRISHVIWNVKQYKKNYGKLKAIRVLLHYGLVATKKIRKQNLDQIIDVNGYKLALIPGDSGISSELMMFKTHEPLTTNLLSKELKKDMVCLDVGGNIGYYTLLESNIVGSGGKVIAIEPSPPNFQRLKKNLEIQDTENVDAYNFAAGDVDGSVNFLVYQESNGSFTIPDGETTDLPGELIKVSNKGVIFKTWEGEISQGISGAQIFSFSILDKDKSVIEKLQDLQGNYVKVSYVERYKSFVFWGDTKYFIVEVQKETSPHFNKD